MKPHTSEFIRTTTSTISQTLETVEFQFYYPFCMLFVFMRDEREKLPKLPTTTDEKTEWEEEKVFHLPRRKTHK